MHFYSLREFIAKLEAENELIRIRELVSPILEIAEITDRVSKSPEGGKALLFEHVEGSTMPVLINAFGSRKRMNIALGVSDMEEVASDIERFLKLTPPSGLIDKVKILPLLLEAANYPPKTVSGSVPCQEVVLTGDAVDLTCIPILQCWPEDAGRFITFPMVINRDADRRIRNVGLYRMQVFDKKTTAMHWHIHKDGAHFFHEFKRRGLIMEVAVAIGGDPASCYAASAPLPYGVDEFLLAGFIRKAPVPLIKCKTVDLEVPATAEIILEGFIDPTEARTEGPFGDHTGYYSQDGDYPVFHVTAITHRKDPLYLTTIVGIPPQEDFYLGKATERIFLPLMRLQLPEIVDMNMPLEGVFHNCVILSIDKRFPMQARRLMSALWGLGQMSFAKTIVIVDAETDVHNVEDILKILLTRIDFQRDLFFSEGILDVLNHASDQTLYGSKLGIDATTKVQGEPGFGEEMPKRSQTLSLTLQDTVLAKFNEVIDCHIPGIDANCPVVLVAFEKKSPGQTVDFIKAFFRDCKPETFLILIVLEGHVKLSHYSMVLWKFFANLDPKRDFHFVEGGIGIDVTTKNGEEGYTQRWPEEIAMSQDIQSGVDEKWNRLF
ncbi:MAG: menaquinone biosynthesis decarboxylase [Nitrospinota bacterium]|nr:menaquinone biosynthesis decarboxylase [Nitrospinota bacterium]